MTFPYTFPPHDQDWNKAVRKDKHLLKRLQSGLCLYEAGSVTLEDLVKKTWSLKDWPFKMESLEVFVSSCRLNDFVDERKGLLQSSSNSH